MGRVKLNVAGLKELADSTATHQAVDQAANSIADAVRGQGIQVGAFSGGGRIDLPVEVSKGQTTDNMRMNRARARVSLAHPAGEAVQAKRGALTKAAGHVGLKVKGDTSD